MKKKIIPITKINLYKDQLPDFNSEDFFHENFFDKNKEIKKILIIKWGGMGDIIQSTSVINEILIHLKSKTIDVNTKSQWKCFFENDNRINNVWSIDFKKGWGDWSNINNWIRKVKHEKYDLIIDLQTNDRSRILLSILKILYNYPKYSIGNHFVFPYSIKPKSNINISQPFYRLKRTILSLGIESRTNKPTFIIPCSSTNYINEIFKKLKILKKDLYIFIPGSSSKNLLKRWGVKNYIGLAKLLESKKNKVILVGGNEDIEDCNNIAMSSKNIINLCNELNLLDLVELFKRAKYIIANDTGPTHLTALTSTPVLQITGPTDPAKVKPFGKNICALQAEINCKNCYKKTCSHHSCMIGIKPTNVYNFIFNKK